MKPLTRLQALEKQNKDLRIRLENREGKALLALGSLEDEVKALGVQLCEKDKVIAMLQKEIGILTQELNEAKDLRTETMQGRVDAAVDAAVQGATASLIADLAKAHLEIGRLKAIINKDSSNSSKPPSTNGFKGIASSREKSGRKIGGQNGHPGHRLGLPKNMDELVEKGFVHRQVVDHANGSSEYVSRFVIDVEVVTTITEHRFALGARLPENLYNEVSYGDNIKTMCILLLSEGIIAELRLSEMIQGLTNGVVSLSPATLEKFKSQFAEKLESSGELEAIKEDLLNGEVLNTDDTPMRCTETIDYLEDGRPVKREAKGGSFRPTARTHSNANSTFYTVNPKKDIPGIERDGILPLFVGILSHDHEIKFYKYGTLHATCGEHLVRDLVGLRDLQCIPWADGMRAHIVGMNRHKNRDLDEGRSACDQVLLAGFEQKYDALIKQGWAELAQMRENELGYKDFRAMLNRLMDYKDCYLLFMRNYKAPFTNNLAERDLRMEKTKEKVSGLFRSWDGIVAHTKIRSFISTVKKRKMELFSSIAKVNLGIPVLK
jgi:hypothetical protein